MHPLDGSFHPCIRLRLITSLTPPPPFSVSSASVSARAAPASPARMATQAAAASVHEFSVKASLGGRGDLGCGSAHFLALVFRACAEGNRGVIPWLY